MQTMPLPPAISRLFVASGVFMVLSFVFSMVNLGVFSVYIVPSAVIATTAHHITLFVLSKRKVGPPPISNTLDSNSINQSRSSVYRPPSPTYSNLESCEVPIVSREQRAYTSGATYPSYTINVANCAIIFVLALLWACGSWVPFFAVYCNEGIVTVRNTIIPYFEGSFMICESLLLFWLFGLVVHHRRKQLRSKDSIPMTH